MGLLLFSVGMVGEYIGRINGLVRRRKRFRIANVLETVDRDKPADDDDQSTPEPD